MDCSNTMITTQLIKTSLLPFEAVDWIRDFLKHPLFRLYFEASLVELKQGQDNRSVLISRSGDGIILSIEFDSVIVRTSIGTLHPDELLSALNTTCKMELHVEASHLDMLLPATRSRLDKQRILRYYIMRDISCTAVADPRCRLLSAADFEMARDFFAEHYNHTIFSSWMLGLPFVGLFVDDELTSCGGTVCLERSIGVANLGNFLTHPKYRGQKYAQCVLRALLHELHQQGIHTAMLGTNEDNVAACRVYEHVGFEVLETRYQLDLHPETEQQ